MENKNATYALRKTFHRKQGSLPAHLTGRDTPPCDCNFQIGGSVKTEEISLESEIGLQHILKDG
jgi:hypothetical protein